MKARGITLEVNDAARVWLADIGYDPVYGARPLKRVIQRTLENPLAIRILEGHLKEGDMARVSVDDKGEGLVITGSA
ncbi:MAG: ATP-dependent Clp protease ATP-binding subunit ClpB [Rhodospirillaceae bacterium]|nr:MAG: ATP-dependent Clp protease ATP-binding subunit ClpB [Rhodospirillaceae bacterium]